MKAVDNLLTARDPLARVERAAARQQHREDDNLRTESRGHHAGHKDTESSSGQQCVGALFI